MVRRQESGRCRSSAARRGRRRWVARRERVMDNDMNARSREADSPLRPESRSIGAGWEALLHQMASSCARGRHRTPCLCILARHGRSSRR